MQKPDHTSTLCPAATMDEQSAASATPRWCTASCDVVLMKPAGTRNVTTRPRAEMRCGTASTMHSGSPLR
ncbi:hypothetical protein [Streptomyces sp. TS71-3]|uniref:hypothetical protein n=1 Tax=Streptomyces sp. TS71-3 TaxID=2733862 RepID=UPI001B04C375|nr:hypothetical protein [Streptomyces sp. TS71-3]GHJ40020.1 hypothetical protein Sm713_56290 [Streptomyces sp. TS71-3]